MVKKDSKKVLSNREELFEKIKKAQKLPLFGQFGINFDHISQIPVIQF